MKVLITGGAGFIGSHLVDGLLAGGDEVVVLDDLSTGKAENIRHCSANSSFHFVQGSILDEELVRRLASDCPLIYHLAAAVGVHHIVRDPLRGMQVNVGGTESVLAAAFESGAKVILASSSEIYGKSTSVPFKEDDDRVLGSTRVARWSYATAKALDEHFGFAYSRLGLPVVVVRYFNAYGPRLDSRGYGSVVAKFVRQALAGEPITVHGDGKQTRCFTFVEDTVRGTILAGKLSAAEGEAFNIGSSRETSVLELARTIVSLVSLVGSRSKIEFVPYAKDYGEGFEDPPRRIPGVAKAREVLGFEAATPLEVGLARTIGWMGGLR